MNTEMAALNDYIKQLEAALEKQKEVTENNIRRFFIPTIGTTIKIIKDTPVTIWVEFRNSKFLEKIVPGYNGRMCWHNQHSGDPPPEIKWTSRTNEYADYAGRKSVIERHDYYTEWTIPKDTRLVVDRVYIRKGKDMKDFDSITFRIEKQKGNKLTGRFWLKRSDVNNLVVEVVKEEP
jgi:hypothetical protein